MQNRREFLKKTSLLTFGTGLAGSLPTAITKALAIDPPAGSTFFDAEHVVILMQENRSFDHCFGTLQGVRGFNDPRAIRLSNDNPVWMQTNESGETYLPFRLNLAETKATWMGSLPHSRQSQVDAYNGGLYDNWLNASFLSNKKYKHIPFTLGYYTREDVPFNYAMADAFTICDQNFSSAMTSTWPNRHFLWSGNIRERPHDPSSRARIRNDLNFGEASWRTFPELLEQNDISWRIYQNDLTAGGGFEGEERSWLSNFTCNALEYFSQFNVKFSARYMQTLAEQMRRLPEEINDLLRELETEEKDGEGYKNKSRQIRIKQQVLQQARQEAKLYTPENFAALSDFEKRLFEKAFTTNREDPHYHTLENLIYTESGEERSVKIPKGDIFHQFRSDVRMGKLPAVSWLVAPQKFSDHPSAPWYGSWYVSEVLNILTENPELWKKTIFILTYDENDGYFDHIPPFMPPDPGRRHAGKCSEGMDGSIEFISKAQEIAYGVNEKAAREGMAGLGYRVPMIIASPWSRGGRVNSQVFDHTSILRFLEIFLSNKTGKNVLESNIGSWRRSVCGDLTSVFKKFNPDNDVEFLLQKKAYIEKINNAQFRQEPDNYRPLTDSEIEQLSKNISSLPIMPSQEPGVRPSCALPYHFYTDGNLERDGRAFMLQMTSSNEIFGSRTSGVPFTVYSNYLPRESDKVAGNGSNTDIRQYAVAAGEGIRDKWDLENFPDSRYKIRVSGPNGFFREFGGNAQDPGISVACLYEKGRLKNALTGNLILYVENQETGRDFEIILENRYTKKKLSFLLLRMTQKNFKVDLRNYFGWYDVMIRVKGYDLFHKIFAGRVETGSDSITDPLMGRVIG